MKDVSTKTTKQESDQQELQRLIRWAKDNPRDWNCLCNPESYDPKISYLLDLIERLYQEKLYTAIFILMYSNSFLTEIDSAITKTTNECFLETPIEVLMERFHKNLGLREKETEQNG